MIRCIPILLLALLSPALHAQTDTVAQAPHSVNEATMISLGSRYVKNTYLSDVGYDGTGIGVTNERMRLIGDRWSQRRTFRIDPPRYATLRAHRAVTPPSSTTATPVIAASRRVSTVCDCSSAVRDAQ